MKNRNAPKARTDSTANLLAAFTGTFTTSQDFTVQELADFADESSEEDLDTLEQPAPAAGSVKEKFSSFVNYASEKFSGISSFFSGLFHSENKSVAFEADDSIVSYSEGKSADEKGSKKSCLIM